MKIKKIKLVLFDADNTLWKTGRRDYVSKLDSSFYSLSSSVVVREKDGHKFVLGEKTREVLKLLSSRGVMCGLVSDNHLKDVQKVCQLFRIGHYFDPLCIEVKLFDGYCPKHLMVKKILARIGGQGFVLKRNEVLWIDDKDYHQEAEIIGVNFFHFKSEDSLLKVIKNV